jgi:hypothetical protein
MSGFSVFHVVDNGIDIPKAIPHSRILEVTLKEEGNLLLLKGDKKQLTITDSAQAIAQGLGIWRPRQSIGLTPFNSKNGRKALLPVDLLANTSMFEHTEGFTKLVMPDGQQLDVTETVAEIAQKLQCFNIFLEDMGRKEEMLIF